MSELKYWLALSLAQEIGPVLSRRLIGVFGAPSRIFGADRKSLCEVDGIGPEKAARILGFSNWAAAEGYIRICERRAIRILTYDDPLYPAVLKEVDSVPPVIYMAGEYRAVDRYAIGVVGSRKHTSYGEVATRKLSTELASAGLTIISGLARGIDTIAHKAALDAGGRTIAVLGSGLDLCYPPENRKLMKTITESGAVLSEFPPGTRPLKENFPRRNRLISGLSLGVLVVEAAAGSGSLITAGYALEQNREVFAVPGNITSPNSAGTNQLIRQGAKVVSGSDDIIADLAPVLKGFMRSEKTSAAVLSEDENRLCLSLSREPKHIDLLYREVKLPVNKMLDILLSLELKGVIRQSGGKRFYLS